MLSTPTNTFGSYFHNPAESLAYIKSLTPKEEEIFTKGYLQASHQMQEAIGDARRTFLSSMLDEDFSARTKRKFQNYIKLLDNFDHIIEIRIAQLEEAGS